MEVNQLKEYIIRLFRPSVIVFSSNAVKEICKENNLSPAELLRPFSNVRRDVVSGRETINQHFRFNFFDSSDYERKPASFRLTATRQALIDNKPEYNFDEVTSA